MKSRYELFNVELPCLILNMFLVYGASSMLEEGCDVSEELEEVRKKIIDMTTVYATNYEEMFNKATLENKKNLKTHKGI
ncbi:MAG: hypothetical protein RR585_14910 [Coprobacillus sp.]